MFPRARSRSAFERGFGRSEAGSGPAPAPVGNTCGEHLRPFCCTSETRIAAWAAAGAGPDAGVVNRQLDLGADCSIEPPPSSGDLLVLGRPSCALQRLWRYLSVFRGDRSPGQRPPLRIKSGGAYETSSGPQRGLVVDRASVAVRQTTAQRCPSARIAASFFRHAAAPV